MKDIPELERLLGRGGSADVYSVTLAGRPVAVKRLRATRSDDGGASLLREAQTLAGLPRHNNIVAYVAALEHEGKLHLVMEQVDGVTLDKLLERRARLPINASIYIMRELLSGLACVHESGVVHRDLSPSNVLIAADGVVKITDFGLARNMGSPVTTATIRGTLGYLSPVHIPAIAITRSGASRSPGRCHRSAATLIGCSVVGDVGVSPMRSSGFAAGIRP